MSATGCNGHVENRFGHVSIFSNSIFLAIAGNNYEKIRFSQVKFAADLKVAHKQFLFKIEQIRLMKKKYTI